MKRLIILGFCMLAAVFSAHATIFYVDAATGDDTNNGLFPTLIAPPDGPLLTINAAITMASPGDTIMVAAGEYQEQISITKPLVLLGAQYGMKPTASSRGAETILLPQVIDIARGPATNNVHIWITAPDVVIDGFSINGNNPSLTSGENVFGVDVDISYGIVFQGTIDNIQITNNILLNYYESFLYAWGGSGITNNHRLNDNYLRNAGYIGTEILGSVFGQFNNNMISRVPLALFVHDYILPTGLELQIMGNQSQTALGGLEMKDLTRGKYTMTLNKWETDNTDASYVAVQLTDIGENAGFAISDNLLKGGNTGYQMSNVQQKHLIILRDSITANQYGIYFNTMMAGTRNDTITLDQTNVVSTNTGLYVFSDNYTVHPRTSNSVFRNSAKAIHFLGNVKWQPLNCRFFNSGFYIYLDSSSSGKLPSTDLSLASCMFDGVLPGSMTHLASFNLEDKIHHYPDFNKLGYLNYKALNYYVSLNDGNTLITPAFAKATDGWNIHIKPVISAEQVMFNKNMTLYTYGYTELNRLEMNGAGKTLNLTGDLNISNALLLSNGNVNSTSSGALHLREGSRVIGGSENSYVNGILYAKGYGSSLDTLHFPVGKGGDYRPARFFLTYSQPSGVTEYSMELFNGALPFGTRDAGIKNASRVHYWEPKMYGTPFLANVSFELEYAKTLNDDQVSDPSFLRMAGEIGGNLTNLGGTGNSNDNGMIRSDLALNLFPKLTLANVHGGNNLIGSTGPIASFEIQDICVGTPITLTSRSLDPYSSLTYYHWDFGIDGNPGDTAVGSTVSFTYPDTGSYIVYLYVRNVFGQWDTTSHYLRVADIPVVSFEYISNCHPAPVVFDGKVSNKIGSITEYHWIIDGTNLFAEDTSFTFMLPGSFDAKLIATNSFGCRDSFEQLVVYDSLPNVVINPAGINHICAGDTLDLNSVYTHYSYSWNTGSQTMFEKVSTTQEVILTAHSSPNCFSADTAFVIVEPLPKIFAGNDTIIYTGTKIMFMATGGESYIWSPAETLNDATIFNPTAKPTEKTTYYLEGEDQWGCLGYDTIVVDLRFPQTIQVPNLLTPNGDGHNDVWDLRSVPGIDNSKVTILDRWGSVIFESPATGYKHNWNGKRLDLEYPEGTYYYIIELYDFNETVKGAMLLAR